MVAWAQIYNLGQVIKALGGNTIIAANEALEQQFSTLSSHSTHKVITKFLWHTKDYIFAYLKKK